ncbi:MAG TPA: aldo/keto reductase [Thermoleophilaceae bacterium]|nr:aldo/keto reductase [Thermoleophilaceae bacterium]
MKNSTLGRTNLEVSPICFGTWQFGGDWGSLDERDNVAAMQRALELGVNFFDTAQAYGFGASEQLVAKALGGELRSRRDEIVIATKGGLRVEGDGLVRDSSPNWLRRGVDESLAHLGIDHIDLYQVHWPDPDTPLEETAGALGELVDEGKIGHVGVSNFDVEEMRTFERGRPVESLQPPYHLFRRDIEDDVLPYCREHDIGVLVYGPLAHGLLSGKFDRDTELSEDDWRSSSELFQGENFERNLEVVEALGRFAEERGHTVAQLAVAWTLAQPGVHVAIVGARRPDHIEGTVPAADIELSSDDLERIESIMEGAVAVAGPTPEG